MATEQAKDERAKNEPAKDEPHKAGPPKNKRPEAEPPKAEHAKSWADPAQGAIYEKGRPGYPPAIQELLINRLGLGPGKTVVDVAAGTGKLTRELTKTGARVIAVEPMPGMRLQLRQTAPAATATAGVAEHLPLGTATADAITAAQAFHWFDVARPAEEFRRVLKPSGALVVVNNRRDDREAWVRQISKIIRDYESVNPRPSTTVGWWDRLQNDPSFYDWQTVELPHEQRFGTLEEFDARFASISYAILLDNKERSAMLADLRAVVAGMEPIVLPMTTRIRIGRPNATGRGTAWY